MKYIVIIGVALLAFYGWNSLQQAADRNKEERSAKLAMQEAQANVTTMPEEERRKWFYLLDQSIDKKIKLLSNNIGLQTRTGYTIAPLTNIKLQCDAFFGIQILVHEGTDEDDGIEASLLTWLDADFPQLSVGQQSPAAKTLFSDLCVHLYKRLDCLGQCAKTKNAPENGGQ